MAPDRHDRADRQRVAAPAALGLDDGPDNDVAVMDNFIYCEPQAVR